MNKLDWSSITYFKPEEFMCSCCSDVDMNLIFMQRLDELRRRVGFPLIVTSGYRCPNHPEEKKKTHPGWHNKKRAADIACTDSDKRHAILKEVYAMGCFGGIGIYPTHIHLDDRHPLQGAVTWTGQS